MRAALFLPAALLLPWLLDAGEQQNGMVVTLPDPSVAPREVRIAPVALPSECRTGDKLDLVFSVLGDVQPASLRFEVKVELPRGREPAAIPVRFTRDQEGRYHGTLTAAGPGPMRVGLSVAGKKTSGEPFRDEVVLPDISVSDPPTLAARFLSLETDANCALDRLDVTALLDVVAPGDYEMSFRIGAIYCNARATLRAGRGEIATWIPGDRIRRELDNGWRRISELEIRRAGVNAGDNVAIATGNFQAADLKLEHWQPVTIRGIRPAPSGRFRFAEVEWNVTTVGGECSWTASLAPASGGGEAHLHSASKLAAGRTPLSLVFPAAGLARSGNREALFHATVNCRGVNEGGAPPFAKLAVDPAQFEPPRASLEIIPQNMLRLPPGGSGSVLLDVTGKKLGGVRFSVTDAPAGIEAAFDNPFVAAQGERVVQGWAGVNVRPDAKPGRYFIGVKAVSAGETAEGEIVLDVVR